MSDYISGDRDSPNAPWNNIVTPMCPICGNIMEIDDFGEGWEEFKCPDCGFWYSDEPDYDYYE